MTKFCHNPFFVTLKKREWRKQTLRPSYTTQSVRRCYILFTTIKITLK